MSRPRIFYGEPAKVHGCTMPNGKSIMLGDQMTRMAAEQGSTQLAAAIDRYLANGGKW